MTGSPESLVSVKSGAGFPSSSIEPSLRRAIGVVRVSRLGDDAVSPSEQAERIEQACARDGLDLVDTLEESNVSGGAPLAAPPRAAPGRRDGRGRPGGRRGRRLLRPARPLAEGSGEVLERVERAGGAVIAVDVGEVRSDTASRWLSSTMLGMVAEYHRRVTAERTSEAKRRAIADGRPTFGRHPARSASARRQAARAAPDRGDDRPRRVRHARERRHRQGGPRVSARERDRAQLPRRAGDARLAHVPRRAPLRRAREHRFALCDRGRRDMAEGAEDARAAWPQAEVRAAAGPARRAPLRNLRRPYGDGLDGSERQAALHVPLPAGR